LLSLIYLPRCKRPFRVYSIPRALRKVQLRFVTNVNLEASLFRVPSHSYAHAHMQATLNVNLVCAP
jgi:hypothetical protein